MLNIVEKYHTGTIDIFFNIYRVIISKFFNLFCTFYWRYWRRLNRYVAASPHRCTQLSFALCPNKRPRQHKLSRLFERAMVLRP